jgi:hypothetical protein
VVVSLIEVIYLVCIVSSNTQYVSTVLLFSFNLKQKSRGGAVCQVILHIQSNQLHIVILAKFLAKKKLQ